MKKDYSVDEMKKIMGREMDIPECVDEGMKHAYEQLGIRTTRRHTRKYKLWTGLAAAAVLTAGLSITAFAVTKYLNVTRSEEGIPCSIRLKWIQSRKRHIRSRSSRPICRMGMNIRKKDHMVENGATKKQTVGFQSCRIMRQSYTGCPEWMIRSRNSARTVG